MNTESKGRHVLGKLSRNCDKAAPRNCEAVLTWELRSKDGKLEFSAQGDVWNHIKSDIILGGQCVDELAALFPRDKLAQRIAQTWRAWHLNGMNAGTPEQEAALLRAKRDALQLLRDTNAPAGCFYDAEKTKPNWYVAGDYITGEKGAGFYGWACAVLKQAGLYEVPVTDELRASALGGLPEGATTYRYGTRWLYRALPDDVVALIRNGFQVADDNGESEAADSPDDDIIARSGLGITAVFVPFSQSRNKAEKSPSLNWRVTLTHNGKPLFLADYSAGCAHAPAHSRKWATPHDKREALRMECEKGHAVNRVLQSMDHVIYGKAIMPKPLDVIASLLLDAGALDAGTFADWCTDCGFDADSIKDRAIYDECLQRSLALRAAVGPAMFDELRAGVQ